VTISVPILPRVRLRSLIPTVLVLLLASVPAAAIADPPAPPPFDGMMTFGHIDDPSGPEEFSWTVELGTNQSLESIDEQNAGVYNKEDELMFTIAAEAAHDFDGTSVPTSLAVTGPNIIALTVHHRAGNPTAGGVPFDYPITPGPSFDNTFYPGTLIVSPTYEGPPVKTEVCLVPSLAGKNLGLSRNSLRRAHCRIGTVHRRSSVPHPNSVVRQGPKPGATLPPGAAVWVTLG
jgi:PASTA domain